MSLPYADHPEYLGLLADVLAAPEDDTPRMLLADWLDDHGYESRADLIREQLAEPAVAYRLRYEGILKCRDRVLCGRLLPTGMLAELSLGEGVTEYWWKRGFVRDVKGSLTFLTEHLPAICEAHPVTWVEALDKKPRRSMDGSEWMWFKYTLLEPTDHSPDLSADVWDLLPNKRVSYGAGSIWARYSSENAAMTDLSAALLLYAKRSPAHLETNPK